MSPQAFNHAISIGINFSYYWLILVNIYSWSQFSVFCVLLTFTCVAIMTLRLLDILILLDTTYMVCYSV